MKKSFCLKIYKKSLGEQILNGHYPNIMLLQQLSHTLIGLLTHRTSCLLNNSHLIAQLACIDGCASNTEIKGQPANINFFYVQRCKFLFQRLLMVMSFKSTVGISVLEYSFSDGDFLMVQFKKRRQLGAISIGNTVSRPEFLFLSIYFNDGKWIKRVGLGKRNVLIRMPIEGENNILEQRAFFEIVDVRKDLVAASDCQ